MADVKKLAEQLKKLNELRGPVPQELRDRVAAQNKAQKAILDALKAGPKTAPELAAAAGLPQDKTLWHVAALRKYGKLSDVPGKGDWPKYEIKSAEAK
jgi:predicted Rossmann fold nucleotide-binding protein DprA/Smf involved in DNA uptake